MRSDMTSLSSTGTCESYHVHTWLSCCQRSGRSERSPRQAGAKCRALHHFTLGSRNRSRCQGRELNVDRSANTPEKTLHRTAHALQTARRGEIATVSEARGAIRWPIMDPKAEHLSSLTGMGLKWNAKEAVLDCTSPHALTRAAGYLKHVLGQRGATVLFRGQTALWKECIPSLFRTKGPLSQHVQSRRIQQLEEYVKEARQAGAFIQGQRHPFEFAHEAILQHYGIRTRWLDVVDNIWVALWFAVHDCIQGPKQPTFWHFVESPNPYSYVLLMSPGEEEHEDRNQPGCSETADCIVVDLRVAAPSLYLRPHAQHGLLFRRRNFPPGQVSLPSCLRGVIRIQRSLAKAWLGAGHLHDPHVVFPPPHYDMGYARLLQSAPQVPRDLGGIGLVFP